MPSRPPLISIQPDLLALREALPENTTVPPTHKEVLQGQEYATLARIKLASGPLLAPDAEADAANAVAYAHSVTYEYANANAPATKPAWLVEMENRQIRVERMLVKRENWDARMRGSQVLIPVPDLKGETVPPAPAPPAPAFAAVKLTTDIEGMEGPELWTRLVAHGEKVPPALPDRKEALLRLHYP